MAGSADMRVQPVPSKGAPYALGRFGRHGERSGKPARGAAQVRIGTNRVEARRTCVSPHPGGTVLPGHSRIRMGEMFSGRKRIRKYFGKIREVAEMPNLIEVQKSSYDLFLESGDQDAPMDGEGIQGVFQSVFPIKDFNETAVLEFVRYELEHPKYDVEECQHREHDVFGAAEGHIASDRVRGGRRNRRQVGQGHQGTRRLYGRHAPDDAERHVHRERHRAGHRQPDAPVAGCVL